MAENTLREKNYSNNRNSFNLEVMQNILAIISVEIASSLAAFAKNFSKRLWSCTYGRVLIS